MFRNSTALTAVALAATAIVPIAAGAADLKLGGAPTMRSLDAKHAKLRLTSDRLPRKVDGTVHARLTFAGGQRVAALTPTGRHGNDIVYTARVTARSPLRIGTKYTLRIRLAGQPTITRKVKLQP